MKNIMKKNQMIITALAIMIAVAGYLNFTGTKFESEDTAAAPEQVELTDEVVQETSADAAVGVIAEDEELYADLSDEDIYLAEGVQSDIESLDAEAGAVAGTEADTEAAAGEEPGEAIFTSSMTGAGIASNAKLLKEQTRAKNKETMLEVINSTAVTDVQKQEAINLMISMVDIAEWETAAEVLLSAKGFSDVVVSITDGTADVLVNAYEVSDAERAQIEDVIKRKTGIPPENLVITPIETIE